MPILWRYLLAHYFKVLGLCTLAFVAILMTTRLDDIARFAALGPEMAIIGKFALHQIPYILPIAIPISSVISSILLIQRLSITHELTAFRSLGFATRDLLAPILLAAAFLSLGNFYIISEMATHSHLQAGKLKKEMRSINPLLLLNNKHLMRLKGGYYENLGPSKLGEKAEDVVLALPNHKNQNLHLITAKKLKTKKGAFIGKDVSFISSQPSSGTYDDLLIENVGKIETGIDDFATFIHDKVLKIHHDYLQLPLLICRIQEIRQEITSLSDPAVLKKMNKSLSSCYSEVLRRCSAALAPFTFTLMGAAFGISISRHRSNRGIFAVIFLAALYLSCFFYGKGTSHQVVKAALFFLVPHVVIVIASITVLKRVTKGIES